VAREERWNIDRRDGLRDADDAAGEGDLTDRRN
jgi:hypothetical protein